MELRDICFQPLNPELFDMVAKGAAFAVCQSGAGRSNKSTQLRKFYDELVMWNDKVQLQRGTERAEKYTELAPFIKMLNAKVAYAKGRGHVDGMFEDIFSHCIKSIKDADSLKHCKLFMEAFMGFYKAQEGNK